MAGVVLTPGELAAQSWWIGQRNAALARGESKMRALVGAHPLVGDADFDRERLARASKDGIQSVMLGHIAARQRDVVDTRHNLESKPERVYGLDILLKESFETQGIQSGTIYDLVIRDHIHDLKQAETIPQIAVAGIAVAAGLASGGSGTVAVLATGTAFGIGSYQAIEELRRYQVQSAAYGAKLLSEEPTMAWVIVAMVGAGVTRRRSP